MAPLAVGAAGKVRGGVGGVRCRAHAVGRPEYRDGIACSRAGAVGTKERGRTCRPRVSLSGRGRRMFRRMKSPWYLPVWANSMQNSNGCRTRFANAPRGWSMSDGMPGSGLRGATHAFPRSAAPLASRSTAYEREPTHVRADKVSRSSRSIKPLRRAGRLLPLAPKAARLASGVIDPAKNEIGNLAVTGGELRERTPGRELHGEANRCSPPA